MGMTEGWYAIGSKRRHYCVPLKGVGGTWSLCKHWLVTWQDVRVDNPLLAERCAECKRKLAKREAKA